MIASAHASEIVERREYLRRIVAVTSMLGRQGLPFRGSDEGQDSTNRGNFLACMELLKEFDPFLQKYNPSSNATYISPTSQNEMIECCAQEVNSVIVSEMTKSKMYAIMADDARSEQLAVCSIANELQQQIQNSGLAELKCVAQRYDGAAVMSGSTGGVQVHFRRLHPEAIYVHCYAHELNLVLCHTCRAVSEAVELFNLLECVYSFFSTSRVNHHKFEEAQSKLGLTAVELVQLSNTRWACQLRSINAILETLPAIFECLSAIGSPIAVGLRAKLYKFSTVYSLLMFQILLSVTEGLHNFLQKETLNLAESFISKQAICDTLRGKRTDVFATELYERTKALYHTHNTLRWEKQHGDERRLNRVATRTPHARRISCSLPPTAPQDLPRNGRRSWTSRSPFLGGSSIDLLASDNESEQEPDCRGTQSQTEALSSPSGSPHLDPSDGGGRRTSEAKVFTVSAEL
uniref:zinc finger MYM-type protein 1-like n=1 Tax=Gasterosteus aculeatus aculeatus TaxID=481459 RepID=UPI001A988C14|nr:zinc finger MYM-type protein 1-like [Gasterosteus aculeatus aculeatus]